MQVWITEEKNLPKPISQNVTRIDWQTMKGYTFWPTPWKARSSTFAVDIWKQRFWDYFEENKMVAESSAAQQVCWILETNHMLKMEKQLTIKNVTVCLIKKTIKKRKILTISIFLL